MQSRTGSRSVTVTATLYWPPAAQLGSQLSMASVPRPTACAPVQAGQVMAYKTMVPSPDSGHPFAHAGARTIVPRMSWLSAR